MFSCLIDPSLCSKLMLNWTESSDGWPVIARANFLLKLNDLFSISECIDHAGRLKEHLCVSVLWRPADITRTVTETVRQAKNFILNPNSALKLVLIPICLDSFQQHKALAVDHLSYMTIFVSLQVEYAHHTDWFWVVDEYKCQTIARLSPELCSIVQIAMTHNLSCGLNSWGFKRICFHCMHINIYQEESFSAFIFFEGWIYNAL